VNVTVFIWKRYAPLVRDDTVFWTVSGADLKGGILSGMELKLESFRSLISGGVAFATPHNKAHEPSAPPAKEGTRFVLNDEEKKEWKEWTPKIPIEPDAAAAQDNAGELKSKADSAKDAIKDKAEK